MTNGQYFRRGMRDGIPICLGYLAVSFAFGIQAIQAGLTVFQATLLSLVNVTSAGQFAGLGVMSAGGTMLEMAATQFIINLRYMLMSTAVSQKLKESEGTLQRLAVGYGMTDEIFAVSVSQPGELSPFYSYGCIIVSVFGWTLGTFLGAYCGEILPAKIVSALGVALYGMFIAIVVPRATEDKKVLIVALSAVILSSIFEFMPIVNMVSSGFRIIIVTVVVAGAAAILLPVEEEGKNG